MTKLTTEITIEELQYRIHAHENDLTQMWTADYFLNVQKELLALKQAAKNPVAWVATDSEGCSEYNSHNEFSASCGAGTPLYAAPILPKQPESEIPFGDLEPIEVTDDMVYAFHNQLSDSALGSDEFTDIKHGLCAALMNIPRPAQPVSEPYKLPYGVINALTLVLQAMELMGDTLNELDALCGEDVEFVTPAFEALRNLLAAAPAQEPK